ncbi:hypothetical protein CBS101457_002532 [Exobasidium rhododendri]|nr:hypothetical protein CBS101457_002532 [Exobasidium rhododendri]
MSSGKVSKKPSAEEIEEKRKQRAEKKQREAEKREAGVVEEPSSTDGKPLFTPREWVNVKAGEGSRSSGHNVSSIRVISWNILAQGLVRRKLFPGSDCLKWKERQAGLCAEMGSHDWDIAAFQEVDKIEVHGPNLSKSGRSYLYEKGYSAKQHGLMIAWRVKKSNANSASSRLAFQEKAVGSKIVYFDHECIGPKSEGRRGLSRVTRNIALFAALASANDPKKGVIVATTHLFWHPLHSYERVRQTGLLKRALMEWRQANSDWSDWSIILAGDFNDQPHSATYKLMTGESLTLHNWEEVKISSIVHKSVDESKASVDKVMKEPKLDSERDKACEEGEDVEDDEEDEGEEEKDEGADDNMPKNCRPATPSDGLLSFSELVQLHTLSNSPPGLLDVDRSTSDGKDLIGCPASKGLTSAYGSHYGSLESDQEGNYFGSSNRGRERFDDPHWTTESPNPHLGPSKEPMWTLHSSIFALTLDYIFLFPHESTVTALLPTHSTAVLEPGVPRKGVCASDHVAIGSWGEAARESARDESGWNGGRSPSPRAGNTPPRRENERSRSPPPRREENRGRPTGNDDGEQNPGNNLHVSGVSQRVTERDLDEAFGKFGKVLRSQVMYDPHSREPRGFAFVTMDGPEAAEAAIAGMSGVDLQGRTLSVQKARRGRARTPTPGRYFGPPKAGDKPGPPFAGGRGGGYPPPPDYRYGGPPSMREPYDRYPPRSPPRGDPYDRYGRPPPRDYLPPRDYGPPPPRGSYGAPPPRGYSPPPRGSRYDDLPPPRSRYDDIPPPSRRYDDLPPPPPRGRYDDPPPRRY